MNFLLKIVEGPNKGAEIALPDGVAVTLGKSDDCDIVLADPTLPDAPLTLEASATGVTAGGEPLEPFVVKTLGATSFAAGPADSPWSDLQWPKPDAGRPAETEEAGAPAETADPAPTPAAPPPSAPAEPSSSGEPEGKPAKSKKGLLAIAALLVVALLVAAFLLLRRGRAGDSGDADARGDAQAADIRSSTVAALAEQYGLSFEDGDNGARISGNFTTRRERLAATARFYEAQPGIMLDVSDDESLRTAAEDTLAMISESDLRVSAATNRVLALSGRARDIRRALEVLSADIPKLRDVDVSQVVIVPGATATGGGAPAVVAAAARPVRNATESRVSQASAANREKSVPSLPVCGILTAPYPCLVLRSGARVLEGAPLGDGVVMKIEADSVTITNSAGSFTWKP